MANFPQLQFNGIDLGPSIIRLGNLRKERMQEQLATNEDQRAERRLKVDEQQENRLQQSNQLNQQNTQLDMLKKVVSLSKEVFSTAQNQDQWDKSKQWLGTKMLALGLGQDEIGQIVGAIPNDYSKEAQKQVVNGIDDVQSKIIPTDIDDYVNRANEESIRMTGKPLTPAEQNKRALEFKRAQPEEVAATTQAKKDVEIATSEKIEYNKKLGSRLAEIATQADLMKAKGEVSDTEKQTEAKSRMTGNLAKLAGYYNELDASGAILNTDKGTMENIFRALKSSTAGQAMGRITGSPEQAIRQAINNAKPLIIQDIRQSTNMSARGLDSEKELDFYLQAATDEKKSIQANMAALIVLDEAYGTGQLASQLKDSIDSTLISIIKDAGEAILKRRPSKSGEKTKKPLSEY